MDRCDPSDTATNNVIEDIDITSNLTNNYLYQKLPLGVNNTKTIIYYKSQVNLPRSKHIPPFSSYLPTTPITLPPQSPTTAMAATLDDPSLCTDNDIILPFCNVSLSPDPHFNTELITLNLKGNHPTQGLDLIVSPDCENCITVNHCKL